MHFYKNLVSLINIPVFVILFNNSFNFPRANVDAEILLAAFTYAYAYGRFFVNFRYTNMHACLVNMCFHTVLCVKIPLLKTKQNSPYRF